MLFRKSKNFTVFLLIGGICNLEISSAESNLISGATLIFDLNISFICLMKDSE